MHIPSLPTVIASVLLISLSANAEDKEKNQAENGFELNEAQSLIYDRNQLAMLHVGDSLVYDVSFYDAKGELVDQDNVTLTIIKEEDAEHRSAAIEFLSGEKRLPFADFPGSRGNPLFMAALTRDVVDMRDSTSGSDSYFRNRLRYAFAEDPKVTQSDVSFNGKDYNVSIFTLTPYVDDKLIERFPKFENKQYTFTIGDEVPGGIYSIDINNPGGTRELYELSEWSMK